MTKSNHRLGAIGQQPSADRATVGPSERRSPAIGLRVAVVVVATAVAPAWAHHSSPASGKRLHAGKPAHEASTASGLVGLASYYANKFSGRKMADGTPMRPESDNAASPSLPLGSKALVTNLHNGRTALVTIRDRGPFVRGRIIDVSPSTARSLGMISAGVVRVAVRALGHAPAGENLDALIAAAGTVGGAAAVGEVTAGTTIAVSAE